MAKYCGIKELSESIPGLEAQKGLPHTRNHFNTST